MDFQVSKDLYYPLPGPDMAKKRVGPRKDKNSE
jgi:hypothetical protein